MSYTFSATGLPPGLSLVGSQILGTPSTPGNYTVTLTVSDGVSSVSETVSLTIAPASVPLPFWQLIITAAADCYASESYHLLLSATADAGSRWRDEARLNPLLTAEAGSRWLDTALVATAESGAYWQDGYAAVPIVGAESGAYWHDRALPATADSGSVWLDHAIAIPVGVVATGAYWQETAQAAIADSGSYGQTDFTIVSTGSSLVYLDVEGVGVFSLDTIAVNTIQIESITFQVG